MFLAKFNMHFQYRPALATPRVLPREVKPMPNKDLCANTNSFIHDCQKLETIQMPAEWNTKQQKGTHS